MTSLPSSCYTTLNKTSKKVNLQINYNLHTLLETHRLALINQGVENSPKGEIELLKELCISLSLIARQKSFA